jgi:hypothetical protein
VAIERRVQTLVAHRAARTDSFGHLLTFEAIFFSLGRIS